MRIIDCYGFGDTGILLTEGLNRLGIETDMLVSNRQFAGQMPSWTKKYKHVTSENLYVHHSEDTRDPNNILDFAKFVNSYDQAILHRPSDMYADTIKIPYHIWDGGSVRFVFPPSKVQNPPVEADKAAARRATKHARTVFATDIDTVYKFFHVENRTKPWQLWKRKGKKFPNAQYVPLPVDTDLFAPRPRPKNKYFTIYLPSRTENEVKGNKDMLVGIKQFLSALQNYAVFIDGEKVPADPAKVRVKMTLFGSDAPMVPLALSDLGLAPITEIVPLLPKHKFAHALNRADVVIDQLRLGAYGGVAIQAMSCARPVIVNAWRPWYREQLGAVPPILYARSAHDVAAQLLHAYDFYERGYHALAEGAREYAVDHHHYMRVAETVRDRLI